MLCRRPLIALLVLLSLTLLGSCGGEEPRATRPNIILISMEATRPEHLSAYGYERQTSAFIDSLAAEGVRFDQAYSVSSWTVPAVASLVTGTYPAKHGVVHGVVQNNRTRTIQGQEILSADLPHLARILKAEGYRTFGITANGHLSKDLGYGEGFDFYHNLDFKHGVILDAESVNRHIRNWRGQMANSQPYFLWIHYFDPHDAYHARKPWITDYYPDYKPHRKSLKKLTQSTPKTLASLDITPDGPRHQCLVALYDSEISFADQGMREILSLLKVTAKELIVVTSDHGEEFLDHGGFGHASSLFEEQVRIPLVFRLPGGRAKPVVQTTPVSLVDISPTILDYLHLDIPDAMQGRSLMPLMGGKKRAVHEGIWMTLDRATNSMRSFISGDWKLIMDHTAGEVPHLYNLAKDPTEQVNLADENPDKVFELMEKMAGMRRTYGSDSKALLNTEGLSEAETEKLRSMGYVR